MNNCHFSLKILRKKKRPILRSNTFGVGNVRESRCGQKNVSVWEEKSEGGKRKSSHHAVSIHGSELGYHVLPTETLRKSLMERGGWGRGKGGAEDHDQSRGKRRKRKEKRRTEQSTAKAASDLTGAASVKGRRGSDAVCVWSGSLESTASTAGASPSFLPLQTYRDTKKRGDPRTRARHPPAK